MEPITALLIGGYFLTKYLINHGREIIEKVITFAKHIMGWAREMFHKCADFLKNGGRIIVLDVPPESIPPKMIPPEKLKKAKKVILATLYDENKGSVEVDKAYIATQGIDSVLDQHFCEGEGMIDIAM